MIHTNIDIKDINKRSNDIWTSTAKQIHRNEEDGVDVFPNLIHVIDNDDPSKTPMMFEFQTITFVGQEFLCMVYNHRTDSGAIIQYTIWPD